MSQQQNLCSRLLHDDGGQDLIEYGLLASILAIAGILVIPTIEAKLGPAFTDAGTTIHNLWIPNDPAP